MKANKTKISIIILSLFLVAVFFYLKGRNTDTATILPRTEPIGHSKAKPLDETKWYRVAYQEANDSLKTLIQNSPIRAEANPANKTAYQSILAKALSTDNFVIAGFAQEKIAELNRTDTNYMIAADLFILETEKGEDPDKSRFALAKAKQLYLKATELNPNNILANNKLAVSIIQLNEDPPMVGIGYIKKSLSIDSNDLSTNLLYGQLLLMSGQNEKAIKVYNKLVNLQPSNAEFLFKLSDIYGQLGNTEKAKEFLDKAKNLNQP